MCIIDLKGKHVVQNKKTLKKNSINNKKDKGKNVNTLVEFWKYQFYIEKVDIYPTVLS